MTQGKKVGEILKAAREKSEQSLNEISQNLKINTKYLQALESGNYSIFSSIVHLKGFLKNYAKYLGLNEEEVLAFWRREYGEIIISNPEANKPPKPVKNSVIELGPAFFSAAGVGLLVIFFLGYLGFQYFKYSSPPSLLVSQPEKDIVVDKPEIDVFGVASKEAHLTVNGQEVILGEGGEFLVKLPLQEGMNLVNIVAKNDLEKETKKTFKVVYSPPLPPPVEREEIIPPSDNKEVPLTENSNVVDKELSTEEIPSEQQERVID